ncbi:MAG: DUF6538 domain-containing protein [Burkholderia sp.]
MRCTYQDKHGTYYSRLIVPKALLPYVSTPRIIQSLRTKDRKQAYLRSMQINLAFERWVAEMKNKFGLDGRELTISLPSGVKIDFDMTIPEERTAYDAAVEQIGAFKQPVVVERSASHSGGAGRYKMADIFESYKSAKKKYLPRLRKLPTSLV